MIGMELTETQRMVREYAHQLAVEEMRPISLECDRTEQIPEEYFWRMKRHAPGGTEGLARAGRSRTGQAQGDVPDGAQGAFLGVLVNEEMAWGDAALSTAIPGPGLAYPPIRSFGTPEQQQRFLSIYNDDGLHWGALALSEPGVGSDVASIATTATLEGDEYVVDGTKHYITNGARADLVIVFATVDKRLGRAGIKPFVVPRGTPGFAVGRIEKKMGLRASQTAELIFDHCRIPRDHLLAGSSAGTTPAPNTQGGFKAAMGTLDATRPMVGALATGIARAAHEMVSDWAHRELPRGYPFRRRHLLDDELETLGREIEAARLLVWRAAWMADQRLPNTKEASIAKAYAGALVMRVTAAAVRMMAPAEPGPPKWFVEKWFRDAKVFDIFEGTAQIQRVIIARRLFGEAAATL
jgi:acyl-CoA dehydrogenase